MDYHEQTEMRVKKNQEMEGAKSERSYTCEQMGHDQRTGEVRHHHAHQDKKVILRMRGM